LAGGPRLALAFLSIAKLFLVPPLVPRFVFDRIALSRFDFLLLLASAFQGDGSPDSIGVSGSIESHLVCDLLFPTLVIVSIRTSFRRRLQDWIG